MPSPFPGIDPYLKDPALRPDVHHGLITSVGAQLMGKLRPLRCAGRIALTSFTFQPDDPAGELYVVPDVRVVQTQSRSHRKSAPHLGGGTATQTIAAPIDVTGLAPMTARHRHIEVREAATGKVITVIEILSPANKVQNSAGRRQFLQKRDQVHDSDVSWLEIDLLRRGTPTWDFQLRPRSAYRAYADRTTTDARRQLVWPISLRERLPILPVPLRPTEQDVPLDLQAGFDAAYDAAGYDMDADYAHAPTPPLDQGDRAWADRLLRNKGLRS